MSIKAIIWDLGGVLLRTDDYKPREQLAQELGMSRAELEFLVFAGTSGTQAQRGQITAEQHWENVRQALGKTPEEMPAVMAGFWGGDRIDAELIDTIRQLHLKYKTGLLSNGFSNVRKSIQNDWKIEDLFDEMVFSAEEGFTKPDARIYQIILARLNVLPEEAIFIDDFSKNVDGARAIGMYALQFTNPTQAQSDLEKLLLSQNS